MMEYFFDMSNCCIIHISNDSSIALCMAARRDDSFILNKKIIIQNVDALFETIIIS